MYTLAITRAFPARHFLVGGDWGPENEPHVHEYRVEVRLEADRLDRHGYIVDICELEDRLDELVARYRDRLLNDLPEFAERNPSLERFSRFFFDHLTEKLGRRWFASLEVRLWETPEAWASYRERFR